jgi:hypothetical protein
MGNALGLGCKSLNGLEVRVDKCKGSHGGFTWVQEGTSNQRSDGQSCHFLDLRRKVARKSERGRDLGQRKLGDVRINAAEDVFESDGFERRPVGKSGKGRKSQTGGRRPVTNRDRDGGQAGGANGRIRRNRGHGDNKSWLNWAVA